MRSSPPLLSPLLNPLAAPRTTLLTLFIFWKAVLLVVVLCSPGPGYDTSTTVAFEGLVHQKSAGLILLARLCTKLTRWDAIWFSNVARRGYVFEQEWAFGWGFTHCIRFFARDLRAVGFLDVDFLETFVAVTLAHAAHGLSVLVLYQLALAVFPEPQNKRIALVAACLHVISPAGIFLSAPYGESTFALLSFCGYLLFVWSFGRDGQVTAAHDGMIAAAGLFFAAATTCRTNGVLNGLLYLEEVFRVACASRHGITIPTIRRLFATGMGGIFIAAGFLVPQYIAFREFCGSPWTSEGPSPSRPWCKKSFPSIYAFVQSHYWDVGFLRYWDPPNIPLFILAAPMLIIIFMSSLWAMGFLHRKHTATSLGGRTRDESNRTRRLLFSLAIPQFVLAIPALTNYHVQIITRLASGYCLWYFWLAVLLSQPGKAPVERLKMAGQNHGGDGKAGAVVMYMVMYAAIQAGLFSSFLPPA